MTSKRALCYFMLLLAPLSQAAPASSQVKAALAASRLQHLRLEAERRHAIAQESKPAPSCFRHFYQTNLSQAELGLVCANAIRVYHRTQSEYLKAMMAYKRAQGKTAEASRLELDLDRLHDHFVRNESRLKRFSAVNKAHVDTLKAKAQQFEKEAQRVQAKNQTCYQRFFTSPQPLREALDYPCSQAINAYYQVKSQSYIRRIAFLRAIDNQRVANELRNKLRRLQLVYKRRAQWLTTQPSTAYSWCTGQAYQTAQRRCIGLTKQSYTQCIAMACRTQITSRSSRASKLASGGQPTSSYAAAYRTGWAL